MKMFVFAWYPSMPAPCEGDDVFPTKAIRLHLKSAARVDRAIQTLELRLGGYVQWWG